MDPNLLTLYLVAGGLSLSLSLVLTIFARFLPGAMLARRWAVAILVLSSTYCVAGLAPWLPRWTLVLGTNMALLAGCVLLYEAILAHGSGNEVIRDRIGWAVILATGPFFAYWGFVDPNGNYRSVVFSLAAALINGRTAAVLARAARHKSGSLPLRVLAVLFAASVAWMMVRAGILLVTDPMPPDLRGTNPTTWASVFWYIILVSAMSIIVMWMETHRSPPKDAERPRSVLAFAGLARSFDHKLFMLSSGVVVMVVAVVAALSIAYTSFQSTEHGRMIRAAKFANDAFVAQTEQVFRQAGTVLNAVLGEYERTRSTAGIDRFVRTLSVDRMSVEDIGLISADGRNQMPSVAGDVSASDYFRFHRDHTATGIFVSTDDGWDASGLVRLRLSRRVDASDGSFGGVVIVTVNPESFALYNRELAMDIQSLAAMAETRGHRLLARIFDESAGTDTVPEASLFWNAFEQSPSGIYEGLSFFGDVRGVFAYRPIGDFPLVMITGFAQADLMDSVHARMRWMVLVSMLVLAFSIALALLLTVEAKRNDEQDRFMSMLNHELKTPMSVIRMALGFESVPADVQRRVSRAVADMNAIIDRCLQSDRLRHGRIQSATTTCRVDLLVERIRTECAQPERVSLRCGKVPSCDTDERLLGVIIANLIDNAIKYGPTDEAVNVVVEHAEHKGSPGIRIAVTNALGAAGAPDPQQVFSKYYRAPGAHGKTGSGLGLHIAVGFARHINGELRYLPSLGAVEFELWIPA